MTRFLASVTGLDEAEIAIAGGADIVDLKDPGRGALGALPTAAVAAAVAGIGGRRPVSAVIGDLPMRPEPLAEAAEAMAATGVDFVKVGFFPAAEAAQCAAALGRLAGRVKLVAVLFADLGPDLGLLPAFAQHGFTGAMLDTADKDKGRLLDHLAPLEIPGFVSRVKALGMSAGLAGSLEAPDVPRLLPFAPDLLGFRGALCAGGRGGSLDPAALDEIRALIPEENRPDRSARVDYRLLAARGYAPGSVDPALGTDRIFVRDFVLPVEIGAYSFEHGHTQKVRFDVAADVLRVTAKPEDMRHVFSYDIIMDGIRAIVARGHVVLSEALAEEVAAHVLENPRVTRVTVRVEKLELGPGGVGVEIDRPRAKAHVAAAGPPKAPEKGRGGGKKGAAS